MKIHKRQPYDFYYFNYCFKEVVHPYDYSLINTNIYLWFACHQNKTWKNLININFMIPSFFSPLGINYSIFSRKQKTIFSLLLNAHISLFKCMICMKILVRNILVIQIINSLKILTKSMWNSKKTIKLWYVYIKKWSSKIPWDINCYKNKVMWDYPVPWDEGLKVTKVKNSYIHRFKRYGPYGIISWIVNTNAFWILLFPLSPLSFTLSAHFPNIQANVIPEIVVDENMSTMDGGC